MCMRGLSNCDRERISASDAGRVSSDSHNQQITADGERDSSRSLSEGGRRSQPVLDTSPDLKDNQADATELCVPQKGNRCVHNN